jgi:hypothetical protein
MAITETANKDLNVIGIGDAGWGPPLNLNADIIDKALGSFANVPGTSGSITLTPAQYQCMCLKSDTASFLANVTFVIPSGVAGQWLVNDRSSASSFKLLIKNAASADVIEVPNGQFQTVYSDGITVFIPTPRTVKVTYLTSGTGTHIATPGIRSIRVTAVGGGGGGGSARGGGSGTAGAGGGGGAGGSAQVFTTSVATSYTYTVGGPGAGGLSGNPTGGTGGTTTFSGTGISLSVSGGAGGSRRDASAAAVVGSGGQGGLGSGGNINIRGQSGFSGQVVSGLTASQGTGGASGYGFGGVGEAVSGSTGGGNGSSASSGFGGGGGGAAVAAVTTSFSGGDGSGGLIIVEEFA